MNHGLKPRRFKDHRRYDYFRTFNPKLGGDIPDFQLPVYSNPNQNEADPAWPRPALPNGCTGFAQAHIAEADLKQPVDPAFIYQHTLDDAGLAPGSPCTLEDSFKAATIWGVKAKDGSDPLSHRLAPYFEVRPQAGQDWFDAIRAAVYTNQRPVSVGTTWPSFFEHVRSDGKQTYTPTTWVGGHDHCIIGSKTFPGGDERLIDISWNGPDWGDHGLSYFTRGQVNAMMKIPGSDALTSRILGANEVKTVWVNMFLQGQLLALLISFYQRLIKSMENQSQTPAQTPETVPASPAPSSTVPESDELDWSTPKGAYHAARVTADDVGLTVAQKDILCACIYQESRFMNRHADGSPTFNQNKDKTQTVWSTDWGIVQINDYYHIGPGKEFESVAYVMDHPDKAVAWMARILRTTGKLTAWSSYASGAYKQWLVPTSPMWALKS